MIATLSMYDWPEVRERTDAFWARVAAALTNRRIAAPSELSRPRDPAEAWHDPDLLVGQTCGLPFVSGRCGTAVLVGRPVYDVEGAGAGLYRSALICRAGAGERLADFDGARVAINDYGSQSGCNALADAVRGIARGDAPFFAAVTVTGTHRASAQAVAGGEADLAAIDAVAWALFRELEGERYARLKVLDWTEAVPALPFITARRHAERRSAILEALREAGDATAGAGIPASVLPAEDRDYDPIRTIAERIRGMRLAPGTPPL